MRIFLIIFYLFLIFLGAVFAALNATSVKINLFVTSFTLPVSVLVITSVIIGVLLGSLVFLGKYWHLKSEQHKLKNQLKLTEKEIRNLRSIPLNDKM